MRFSFERLAVSVGEAIDDGYCTENVIEPQR
jgi:hypothetical protein